MPTVPPDATFSRVIDAAAVPTAAALSGEEVLALFGAGEPAKLALDVLRDWTSEPLDAALHLHTAAAAPHTGHALATAQALAAYVNPATGTASGVVGRPDRPYQTLPQGLGASSLVILQRDASMGAISTTGDCTIVIPAGVSLTCSSYIASGASAPRRFSLVGEGNLLLASSSPGAISDSNTALSIDLRGRVEFASGHSAQWSSWSITFAGANSLFLRARFVRIHNSGAAFGPLTCYNFGSPGVVVGEGTRIVADGPIVSPGGPGGNPKIHLAAGTMLWRADGGDVLNQAGSNGAVSSGGTLYRGTIGSGVSLQGSWTDASAWLQLQHLTTY